MNYLPEISKPQFVAPPPWGTPHIKAVAYDLNRYGQNYVGLTGKLDELGAIRIQQSLWWTCVTASDEQLRSSLLPFVDYNDSLMVMTVTSFAGFETRPDVHAWIERHAVAAGMDLWR